MENKKIIPDKNDIISKDDNAVKLDRNGLKVKKDGNVIIGTLNVFARPLKNRHEKHYKESTFHFLADVVLVFMVLFLSFVLYYILHLEPKAGIESYLRASNREKAAVADAGFEQDLEAVKTEAQIEFNIKAENNFISLKEKNVYTLIIKNNGTDDLKDLMIDMSVNNKNFILKNDFNKIIIDEIKADEVKQIVLDFAFEKVLSAPNQYLGLNFKLNGVSADANFEKNYVSDLKKVESQVNILSNFYYYNENGDQLGVGPLPPEAGIPTSYYVIWNFNNNGNNLSNYSFEAEIGEKVSFNGIKSLTQGNLVFDKESNRITWEIDSLPENLDSIKAVFELSVLPADEDMGNNLILLKNQKVYYYDEFVKADFKKDLSDFSLNIGFE
jgi:hypothetical protein